MKEFKEKLGLSMRALSGYGKILGALLDSELKHFKTKKLVERTQKIAEGDGYELSQDQRGIIDRWDEQSRRFSNSDLSVDFSDGESIARYIDNLEHVISSPDESNRPEMRMYY